MYYYLYCTFCSSLENRVLLVLSACFVHHPEDWHVMLAALLSGCHIDFQEPACK